MHSIASTVNYFETFPVQGSAVQRVQGIRDAQGSKPGLRTARTELS